MAFYKILKILRIDYLRLIGYYRKGPGLKTFLNFMLAPGFLGVVLFRISHYFQINGLKVLARIAYIVNLILFGIDIAPASEIGEGLLILHTNGIMVSAKIGNNALMTADIKIGGDTSVKDIGAGPGLPLIGDNVFFGAGAMILGPHRIGNGVFICARSFITFDVQDNTKIKNANYQKDVSS